jgi:hypothetical protein
MKKSELASFIKEEIKSALTVEDTQQDIKDTEELTKATAELAKVKKEAGIEEGAIDPAEYGDIGKGYLLGFNKPHSLNDDDLETLGRKIVKQLYKGDFEAAKAKFLNEEIPTATMSKINSTVTTIPSAAKQMLDFFNQMAEKETLDFMKNSKFKIAIDKLTDLAGDKVETPVTEDEDKEPSKSDLKKTKGLAKAKEELAQLTKQMKSLARKYKEAEGEEKDKIVADLKKKTKLKKELNAIIDK